jgi:hypothetical protein
MMRIRQRSIIVLAGSFAYFPLTPRLKSVLCKLLCTFSIRVYP